MNNPEYILVDEFAAIASAVKAALGLPVLNYQFGYVKVLNQTLAKWSQTIENAVNKYPLIWLAQPFTVNRDLFAWYGTIPVLKIFIIEKSDSNLTNEQRMDLKFRPVIYPIYRQLLKQLDLSPVFDTGKNVMSVETTDRFFWGENQQTVLDDIVDCMEVSLQGLKINNNQNCVELVLPQA